ncbi:MAG: diaminopimelate epimerase [Raoultibacter sp.]
MELDFVKLHGLGNDFIVIDDFSRELELTPQQVALMCDRHFGIGADGIILVRPSHDSACVAYMHYINSDGTLSQMCGNGIRCFAKYLVDRGFVATNEGCFVADTLAGPRSIRFTLGEHDRMREAVVDMGHPILDPARVPVALKANAQSSQGRDFVREAGLDSPWGTFHFTCVSMGNPHAVCFLDKVAGLPDALFAAGAEKTLAHLRLDNVGAFFESHPAFPEKVNVEFAVIEPDGSITMRVFERGCGETLACGTGACATLVAAALTNRSACTNTLHLRGGDLAIDWDEKDHVHMRGPAKESFEGRYYIN